MSHSYETGRAMAELGAKQPHELLLMLGGLLAVLLTLAKYGIQWATPPGIASGNYATVATALVINVVLGGALWVSSAISRKNLMNGAIVAAVISIILIYYGGQSGQIGGVVGIFGAILAAAKPYLPWSRRDPACAALFASGRRERPEVVLTLCFLVAALGPGLACI